MMVGNASQQVKRPDGHIAFRIWKQRPSRKWCWAIEDLKTHHHPVLPLSSKTSPLKGSASSAKEQIYTNIQTHESGKDIHFFCKRKGERGYHVGWLVRP